MQELLERRGALFLHWPTPGPPDAQPRRLRLLAALAALPVPKEAVIVVAEEAELVRRALHRLSAEPLMSPHEPGQFDSVGSATRLRGFDAAGYVTAWSAELTARGLRYRIVDTTPRPSADSAAAS